MQTPITAIEGVGEKTAKLFAKIGVYTTDDLLHLYPRRYETYTYPKFISELVPGNVESVWFFVTNNVYKQTRGTLSISQMFLNDGTGKIKLVWYHMPWISKALKYGHDYVFCGKVQNTNGGLIMEQPRFYTVPEYEALQKYMQPVYPQTKGLSNDTIHKIVRQFLESTTMQKQEFLPNALSVKYGVMEEGEAILAIHHPTSWEEFHTAKKRLVFDEFFLFLLSIRKLKCSMEEAENKYVLSKDILSKQLEKNLPYQLTNAQKNALDDIRIDMRKQKPMNRLVQGDVGSGKTILAILSLVEVAENGYQGALMAPTEVLAKQHYESILELLEKNNLSFRVVLLTGSMTAREKRMVYKKIAAHEADIIVGTHALIQDSVQYDNLALVITDEQHRFGVGQRDLFGQKGSAPHVLIMSATPIPRTMALILYGDMDISVVNERPANRLPIKNCVVSAKDRAKAFTLIKQELQKEHQAYIICPMVDDNDKVEAESVMTYTKNLQRFFPDTKIAYLHGRMKASEKAAVMEGFSSGHVQILVSTTVVEVGVNVPNATVIIIENAERFGLAQLHQLRGRVGRGGAQSYCVLIASSEEKAQAARLDVLQQSNDGFYIASEDLRLRGPGDVIGTQQSGMNAFQLADIYADAEILKLASGAVDEILQTDPSLETYPKLLEKLLDYTTLQEKTLSL